MERGQSQQQDVPVFQPINLKTQFASHLKRAGLKPDSIRVYV
jgi:hypothetical protein